MIDITKNKERFMDIMNNKVTRPGKDALIRYLEDKTDFFKAPASTMFHLSCEGGLVQHSLNVYDCLRSKCENPIWKNVFEGVSDESLAIMALLHDVCKANFYIPGYKNQKTYDSEKIKSAPLKEVKEDGRGSFIWESVMRYEVDDMYPLGHGEKSALLVQQYMALTCSELFAIRWHMGYTEDKTQYRTLDEAMEKYPIVLALHEADLEASKLLEDKINNKTIQTELKIT